jgi:hypothetical protein
MPSEPMDEQDSYEGADLGDNDDLSEDERLRREADLDAVEARRERLLGRITVARSKLYEAEDAGDTARVAELEHTLALLSRERDGG